MVNALELPNVYSADYPWSDSRVQAAASILISVLMFIIQDYIVDPKLARWIDQYPKKSKKDDHKFPAAVCNLAWHVPVAIITVWIVYSENWFNEPLKVWENLPDQQMQPPVYYFTYFFCIGYHLQRLTRLVVNPGFDWLEMGAHHVVTIYLLVISIYGNYLRIGIVVLMVNDVSDIFVYVAKICSYVESKALLVTFPLLMITWAYWRIYEFVLTVIPMTRMHPEYCNACRIGTYGMGVLWLLNIYWFSLFAKMAYRLVVKNERRDITTVEKSER